MSEGTKGRIESIDVMLNDINKFNEMYLDKYADADTPKFIIGKSMGGLASSFIGAGLSQNITYNGICYLVPYFDMHDRNYLEKFKPMLQMMGKVSPDSAIPLAKKSPPRNHMKEWKADPLYQGDHITSHNIVVNEEAMNMLKTERVFEKVHTPALVIRAGKDKTVSGVKIKEFYETIPTYDKQMITYDECDHNILQDGEYLPLLSKDIMSWMDYRTM